MNVQRRSQPLRRCELHRFAILMQAMSVPFPVIALAVRSRGVRNTARLYTFTALRVSGFCFLGSPVPVPPTKQPVLRGAPGPRPCANEPHPAET